MTRHKDEPHATTAVAQSIKLDIGQVEPPEEWNLPEGVNGNTTSTTSVSGGESYDPPLVQVRVVSGMEFYDEQEDRVVEFEDAIWFSFRSNPDVDHSTPDDPLRCRFDAYERQGDPDSGPLKLTGNEFARRLSSGRYRNVTGVEEVEA